MIARCMRSFFGNNIEMKMKRLLSIMIPIWITQTAIIGMNFFDTVMSGHAGTAQLAGTSIGANLWMPVFSTVNGILVGGMPIIAQLIGAGHKNKIGKVVRHGIILAVGISIMLFVLGWLFLRDFVVYLGLEPGVVRVSVFYLAGVSFGIVPFFISTVLRTLIDTMGDTGITMKLYLLALPINFVLNYVLIFGKFGFPALGGIGAGVATGITMWFVCFLFIIAVKRRDKYMEMDIFSLDFKLDKKMFREYLRVGVPIGLSILMESGIFAVVAFLIAPFGTKVIAASQAAMNFADVLYMIPLSISLSMTIITGVEVGAKRWRSSEEYANLSIGLNCLLAIFLPLACYIWRYDIAWLYVTELEVVEITVKFIIYSCVFIMMDAIAAPIQGVLRGYKDVRAAFLCSMFSYWIVCTPLGLALDHIFEHGPYSYWQGLDVGQCFFAATLLMRWLWLKKKVRSQGDLPV